MKHAYTVNRTFNKEIQHTMHRLKFYLIYIYLFLLDSIETSQKAKNNGDIYIAEEEAFIKDTKHKMQTESPVLPDNCNMSSTTSLPENSNMINFNELISTCNSSFYIPMRK